MTLAVEAPGSIGEALELLADEPTRLVVAGGTDLLPALNSGQLAPRPMLALGRLGELDGAGRTADGGLFIGARLTLARAQAMAGVLPALARAAAVGPPGVRTAATVGGNVVSARGGDLLPLLTVLDARIETDSVGGRRSTPIGEFLAGAAGRADGPRLRPGELVVGVSLAALPIDAWVERLVLPGNGLRAALAMAAARFADGAGVRVAVQVGTGLPVRVAAAEDVVAGEFARSGHGIDELAVAFAAAVADVLDAGTYLRHAASVCAGRMLRGMVEAG